MEKKKVNILFFANIPVINEKKSIGGATVLANKLLLFLKKENDFNIVHRQIRNNWRPKFQFFEYFLLLFKFPFYLKNIDVVSIHATKDVHFTIAPILVIWCKVFNKKITYHFFGGNFDIQYKKSPKFIKYILNKTILNVDTLFFETKHLINYFKKIGNTNYIWLPNARKANPKSKSKKYAKRFVFISRIIPQKGIDIIIKAANQLPEDYIIDIYGPITKSHYTKQFFETNKVNYKGQLNPDQVISTLSKYDILLLPTYFEGEGYPGIIIEGLSLAKPIITTNWMAIPEIITHDYNGQLIKIKNSNALKKAILSYNETNYQQFSANALKSFENFNIENVFKKITDTYKFLANGK